MGTHTAALVRGWKKKRAAPALKKEGLEARRATRAEVAKEAARLHRQAVIDLRSQERAAEHHKAEAAKLAVVSAIAAPAASTPRTSRAVPRRPPVDTRPPLTSATSAPLVKLADLALQPLFPLRPAPSHDDLVDAAPTRVFVANTVSGISMLKGTKQAWLKLINVLNAKYEQEPQLGCARGEYNLVFMSTAALEPFLPVRARDGVVRITRPDFDLVGSEPRYRYKRLDAQIAELRLALLASASGTSLPITAACVFPGKIVKKHGVETQLYGLLMVMKRGSCTLGQCIDSGSEIEMAAIRTIKTLARYTREGGLLLDLKPPNVLLNDEKAYLIDFDSAMSGIFDDGETHDTCKARFFVSLLLISLHVAVFYSTSYARWRTVALPLLTELHSDMAIDWVASARYEPECAFTSSSVSNDYETARSKFEMVVSSYFEQTITLVTDKPLVQQLLDFLTL